MVVEISNHMVPYGQRLYDAPVAKDISVDFIVGLSVQDMATGEKIRLRELAKSNSLFQSIMTEETVFKEVVVDGKKLEG